MLDLAFIDHSTYSVFPLSPVKVLWAIVAISVFPDIGLAAEKAAPEISQMPPGSRIFTFELIVDAIAYGLWMSVCCLLYFVVIVYGKGNGFLGFNCSGRDSSASVCDLLFRARTAFFPIMTWCALILAW